MNKLSKRALAACLALGLAWCSLARAQDAGHPPEVRIAVVNVERLLADSHRARAAAARIEAEFMPRREKVAAQLRQLRALSDKLAQDTPTLSDRERLLRSRAVGELERTIARAQNQIREDYIDRTTAEQKALTRQIREIVQKLPAQLGVDIVLTRTIWHRPQVDVTDKVAAMLDR